jgi:predicted dehydrogenase
MCVALAFMKLIVIGCGAVFKNFYCDALREMERRGLLSVRVLVDGVEANRKLARQAFPHALGCATLAEGLIEKDLDGAIVLTPPVGHHPILLAIANAHLHAYSEKPLTTALSEAYEVHAAFSSRNLRCKVAYTRRFFPNVRALRALFQQLPSSSKCLTISDGETFRWPINTGGIFQSSDPGAGVVWDKASHNLDLIHWFSPIREIVSVRSGCRPGAVPTDVYVRGTTETSAFELAVSWTAGMPNTINASGGGKRYTCANGLAPWITAEPAATGTSPAVAGQLPATYGDAVRLAIEEFVGAATEGTLSDCAEDVVLTGYIAQVNGLARQLK